MTLRHSTSLFILSVFCALVLPLHDIFNYLFSGTPLVVWKQLLALFLILSFFYFIEAVRAGDGNLKFVKILSRFLVYIVLFWIIASFVSGISPRRIVYGLFAYIGFISFLVAAYVGELRGKPLFLFQIFQWLSIICSAGVVIDYLAPFLDFLPRSSGIDYDTQISKGYLRRGAFLFGTSTTIFPFLSLGVLSGGVIYLNNPKPKQALIALFSMAAALSACYASASRANLLLMVGFAAIFSIVVFGNRRFIKLIPFLFLFVVVFWMFEISGGSLFQDAILRSRYEDVFSEDSVGNTTRFSAWARGLELFLSFRIEVFLGSGVGTTLGMVNDGFRSAGHFESSFFQAFYEGGLVGLFARFLPGVFALYYLISSGVFLKSLGLLTFSWIVFYLASVVSAPTAAAYHTQMVYFFVCGWVLVGGCRRFVEVRQY